MIQHQEADAPIYCSYPLDRAAHLRTDEAQATLREGDSASLILLNNGSALCIKNPEQPTARPAEVGMGSVGLAPVSPAKLVMDQSWVEQIVFLGIDQAGSPVYAGHTQSQNVTLPDGFDRAEWLDIRKCSAEMSAGDAALAGTANGLLQWHKANVFSEDTGENAASIDAGWARKSASSARCLTPMHCERLIMQPCTSDGRDTAPAMGYLPHKGLHGKGKPGAYVQCLSCPLYLAPRSLVLMQSDICTRGSCGHCDCYMQ